MDIILKLGNPNVQFFIDITDIPTDFLETLCCVLTVGDGMKLWGYISHICQI
jgi:hypothetical protein